MLNQLSGEVKPRHNVARPSAWSANQLPKNKKAADKTWSAALGVVIHFTFSKKYGIMNQLILFCKFPGNISNKGEASCLKFQRNKPALVSLIST
jgi:hypothetical protein